MQKKRLTRIRNSFADRNNIAPFCKKMQYKKLNKETRTRLKNLSLKILFDFVDSYLFDEGRILIVNLFSDEVFCTEATSRSKDYDDTIEKIKPVFRRIDNFLVLQLIIL